MSLEQFKIGDHIAFLNDTGGGKIIRISRGLVYVETEEGLTIPVLPSECVIINEEENRKYDAPGRKNADTSTCRKSSGSTRQELIVDLHCKRETNDRDYPILDQQMDCFHSIMRRHRQTHGKVIVFIHGKGDGKLKSAIRTALEECYPYCTWEDAPFRTFGISGATKVRIK